MPPTSLLGENWLRAYIYSNYTSLKYIDHLQIISILVPVGIRKKTLKNSPLLGVNGVLRGVMIKTGWVQNRSILPLVFGVNGWHGNGEILLTEWGCL